MKRHLGLAAIGSLASVLSVSLHAATESGSGDTRAHLEACAKWSEQDGSLGFTNACGEPVALLFIQLNGERWFDRVVEPDERFDIGVPEKIVKDTTWLFTACPARYVPNLRFTVENQTQIAKGQYECVRK